MDKQCRKRLSNRTQTRHNYVFRRLKTCAYMMLMLCFVAARLSLSSTHRNWDEVRWAPTNIDDRLCRHIESIARRAKALGFCARLIMNINWKTSFVQLNFHCNAGETSADCNETEWHCRFDALMSSPCSGRGSHSRRWNQITRQLICHPCANAQTANCVCFSDPTKRTQPFNCQNRVTQLNSHHPNSTESAKPKKKAIHKPTLFTSFSHLPIHSVRHDVRTTILLIFGPSHEKKKPTDPLSRKSDYECGLLRGFSHFYIFASPPDTFL